jgi:geranylgeranyl diphosphate synthase, type II
MNALGELFHQTQRHIDQTLAEYLTIEEPLLRGLQESISYTLFSGGKRIRPAFCFLVAELFGVPKRQVTPLACALEMIHTASLIMDDLPHMDNGRLRRGKPANHLVFGQDVASLASIGLLTKAYEVVLNDPFLPFDKKIPVVSKLAAVVGIDGMVGGQFADLKYLNKATGFRKLEFIHLHKTAALFVASGETAAIIGGAGQIELEAICVFARNVGFAFQLSDDLLDATGTEEALGKPVGHDRGNFVSCFGITRSTELLHKYTHDAIEALRIFGERNRKLLALSQMLLGRGNPPSVPGHTAAAHTASGRAVPVEAAQAGAGLR